MTDRASPSEAEALVERLRKMSYAVYLTADAKGPADDLSDGLRKAASLIERLAGALHFCPTCGETCKDCLCTERRESVLRSEVERLQEERPSWTHPPLDKGDTAWLEKDPQWWVDNAIYWHEQCEKARAQRDNATRSVERLQEQASGSFLDKPRAAGEALNVEWDRLEQMDWPSIVQTVSDKSMTDDVNPAWIAGRFSNAVALLMAAIRERRALRSRLDLAMRVVEAARAVMAIEWADDKERRTPDFLAKYPPPQVQFYERLRDELAALDAGTTPANTQEENIVIQQTDSLDALAALNRMAHRRLVYYEIGGSGVNLYLVFEGSDATDRRVLQVVNRPLDAKYDPFVIREVPYKQWASEKRTVRNHTTGQWDEFPLVVPPADAGTTPAGEDAR